MLVFVSLSPETIRRQLEMKGFAGVFLFPPISFFSFNPAVVDSSIRVFFPFLLGFHKQRDFTTVFPLPVFWPKVAICNPRVIPFEPGLPRFPPHAGSECLRVRHPFPLSFFFLLGRADDPPGALFLPLCFLPPSSNSFVEWRELIVPISLFFQSPLSGTWERVK